MSFTKQLERGKAVIKKAKIQKSTECAKKCQNNVLLKYLKIVVLYVSISDQKLMELIASFFLPLENGQV